jgi:toxin-antitoxin system PIN domain toxin
VTLALDTNVLVHAFREEASRHALAKQVLVGLLRSGRSLAVPLPCVYEFLRVVTHAHIFASPTPLPLALDAVDRLLASDGVWPLTPTQRHPEVLREVLGEADATGNVVHDGHIAALMREHGVAEILTEDRDFGRFAGVRVVRLKDMAKAT